MILVRIDMGIDFGSVSMIITLIGFFESFVFMFDSFVALEPESVAVIVVEVAIVVGVENWAELDFELLHGAGIQQPQEI